MKDYIKGYIKRARGFTLIELLIVIAIIAILTVAFLPTLRGGQSKARDAAKKALLENISVVFENSINDGGTLTDDGNVGGGTCINDYASISSPGEFIKNRLGRTPETFTNIGTSGTHLCSGTGIMYNRVSPTSYILAIEVENAASANVEVNKTAANLTAVNTVSDAINYTDTAVGAGDTSGTTDSKYYYLVAK